MKNWVTEKQLCDFIEENEECLDCVVGECKVYREFHLERKRIDFLVANYSHNEITIIEVKLTATAESIIQIANYAHLVREQITEQSIDLYEKTQSYGPKIKVAMCIFARWFDSGVIEACLGCDITPYRIEINKNEVEIVPIFKLVNGCKNVLDLHASFFKGEKWLNDSRTPENGRKVFSQS